MSWRQRVEALYLVVAQRWRGITILAPVLVAAGMDFAFSLQSDAAIYHHYANQALATPLFHILPKEYPAGALALFLTPLLLPVSYIAVFAVLGSPPPWSYCCVLTVLPSIQVGLPAGRHLPAGRDGVRALQPL